jgi:hypothetical protein
VNNPPDSAGLVWGELPFGTALQVNPVIGQVTIPWALLYGREINYVPGRTRVCPEFLTHGPDAACPFANDPYTVCPYAFWGFRFAIEQLPCWITSETARMPKLVCQIANGRPLQINLNVWRNFPLWSTHRDKIKAAGQVEIFVAEEVAQLEKIWQNHAQDLEIVYFYCHGGVDDLIGPYLQLSDAPIGSNFLEASKPKWPHAPLVFLNGCATGDYSPSSYLSLISDFREAGACGVVGTECSVPELFAEAYATELFPRLFKGERLGQSMLSVRLDFLRKKNNPLGLVYSLYASNEVALRRPVA